MKTLAGGRIGIASQALGIAAGAYELAKEYSKVRKAFELKFAITKLSRLNWLIWLHKLPQLDF